MLILQFILENFHFAINIFAALVFFAVLWLYLDAWTQTKSIKELFKVIGFSLLSFSFLIHSAHIEQVAFSEGLFSGEIIKNLTYTIRFFAYFVLILGYGLDRIEKKPIYDKKNLPAFFAVSSLPLVIYALFFPVLSLFVFILLLRRATVGLENHIKPLVFGFFFIFLYELLSLSRIFEDATNITIYNIVKPFGFVWIITHIVLIVGLLIIGKWVFQYLLKRFQTELFMLLNVSVLIVFLVTTLSFTGIMLKSLRDDALSHLNTDIKVVQYAINSIKMQTLSDAEVVSQSPDIKRALLENNRQLLRELSTSILLAKNQSHLIILSKEGVVLMRGEDNEKIGDSLSGDSLFIKAVRGEKASSVVTRDGVLAPIVSIRSAVPMIEEGEIMGVVIVGTDIDNAFADGLKDSTNLDVSVYARNILSSTTFIAADGKSRFIGVVEEDDRVNKDVLDEGINYSGDLEILNTSYFAVFAPLTDIDGVPVGMLFVGKEQLSILQAASSAMQLTFIVSLIFIGLSVIPTYLVSRFIANQIR